MYTVASLRKTVTENFVANSHPVATAHTYEQAKTEAERLLNADYDLLTEKQIEEGVDTVDTYIIYDSNTKEIA